jgi:hypothetical protein
MANPGTARLHVGLVIEIDFPTFTPRITLRSGRELAVEIVAGENSGFADTVDYEAITVRDDLVLLSWQEHIGTTVVHLLDLAARQAYTVVTPARGPLMRLTGAIDIKSGAGRDPAAGNDRPGDW